MIDKTAFITAAKKTRYENRKTTGKRYLTKSELAEIFKGVSAFTVPKENPNVKINSIKSIGDILGIHKQT